MSNWPRSLIYILLVAMFGVFPALAASVDTSDEIVHDERFWDQLFVDAVHSREACNLDFKPCRAPLQKRVEDYYLRVRGETKFLSDEVAEAASRSLTRVIEDIYRTTGLRPIQGVPEHASNSYSYYFSMRKSISPTLKTTFSRGSRHQLSGFQKND